MPISAGLLRRVVPPKTIRPTRAAAASPLQISPTFSPTSLITASARSQGSGRSASGQRASLANEEALRSPGNGDSPVR